VHVALMAMKRSSKRASQKRYARIHLSDTERGAYSMGLPSLNELGGSNRTRGYMRRTHASVPTPMLVKTAPQPRNPTKSRRVGAIRQMLPSGLVPSSLFAGMAFFASLRGGSHRAVVTSGLAAGASCFY
jgi:hypothetical protein